MSFPQYTPGDVLIWRKPTGGSGVLLIRAEYLYRTDQKVAIKIQNGETRFADPKQLRRPVLSVNVPASQVENYEEAL